ncbi:MAG: hypothetical protein ACM3U2_10750 [Deltaproteobacteria bacterium]
MDVFHRRHARAKNPLGRPETLRFVLGVVLRLICRLSQRLGIELLLGVTGCARGLLFEPSYQVQNMRFFAKTPRWLWMGIGVESRSFHSPQDTDFVLLPRLVMDSGPLPRSARQNPRPVHEDAGDFNRRLPGRCLQFAPGMLPGSLFLSALQFRANLDADSRHLHMADFEPRLFFQHLR